MPEELDELFEKYRRPEKEYIVVGNVINEMREQGNIAIAQTFLRYFQNGTMQTWYRYFAYLGIRTLIVRGEVLDEELDAFIEIAKNFWDYDMDDFFQDRNLLAHSKYVLKLLEVVEYLLVRASDGSRLFRPPDYYWNAYVALFDVVSAKVYCDVHNIKIDKERVQRLYDSIQALQSPEHKKFIRLSNIRDGLETLKEKIDSLSE